MESSGKDTKIKDERNVSFDVLKIISMAMVVALHVNLYGMNMKNVPLLSDVYLLRNIVESFCIVAVNCFVLCTGYFSSTKEIHYKRLISLWIQVATYSTVIYIVLSRFTELGIELNLKDFVKQCFPLLTNQYWFFTCYFLLYMLIPILNRFIEYTDKKKYLEYMIILLVIFSIIDNLNIFGDTFGVQSGYSLTWFLVLYLVAGYIRKYSLKYDVKICGILYVLISLLSFSIKVLLDVFSDKLPNIYTENRLYAYNSPFVLGGAVCLFLFFLNLKISFKYEKIKNIIKNISSLSFSVYLLHEHNMIRDVLWRVVDFTRMENSAVVYLIGLIVIVMGIFMVGIFIEKIRIKISSYVSMVVKNMER